MILSLSLYTKLIIKSSVLLDINTVLKMQKIQIAELKNTSVKSKLDYKDNALVFSSIDNFEKPVAAEGISIKYVLNGTENYILNRKKINLNDNECFISNLPLEGKVTIDSKKPVNGICVHISYDLITEIASSYGDSIHFEGQSATKSVSLFSESIFDVYPCGRDFVSQRIKMLQTITQPDILYRDSYSEEMFFKIGEAFVLDQIPRMQYLKSLDSAKPETRKDILKRLFWAKDYMDAYYHQDISVKSLAKIATMSEFHFSRMFKMVFGYSPYQYQINLRMHKAKELLYINKDIYVYDVALATGYSDIHVFSKAFKKYFGIQPSSLRSNQK